MTKKLIFGLCSAMAVAIATPAAAAVVGAAGVTLGSTPTAFTFSDASFLFSYDPSAPFFTPAYSVQTTGTAQTSAVFGQPSPFDQRGITIDGNLFPSYSAIPTQMIIPYSQVAEDLALRYTVGTDAFYGYARLDGDGTLDFAFENAANTAITAGATITGALPAAVPEPTTWAMMLMGFGAVGYGMRRRARTLAPQIA